jgi:hypothetical protein
LLGAVRYTSHPSETTRLGLEPISGLENYGEERPSHGEADADAYHPLALKAPVEAIDQIHDGIEQSDRLPEGRQHIDRIKMPPKNVKGVMIETV